MANGLRLESGPGAGLSSSVNILKVGVYTSPYGQVAMAGTVLYYFLLEALHSTGSYHRACRAVPCVQLTVRFHHYIDVAADPV